MKTKSTLIALSIVSLLAGAAFAGDFNPIADADYLAGQDSFTPVMSMVELAPGPHFDADWGEPLPADADQATVAVTFNPIADADYLAGATPAAVADAGMAVASCDVACSMDCGSACASHCGPTCTAH